MNADPDSDLATRINADSFEGGFESETPFFWHLNPLFDVSFLKEDNYLFLMLSILGCLLRIPLPVPILYYCFCQPILFSEKTFLADKGTLRLHFVHIATLFDCFSFVLYAKSRNRIQKPA